MSVGVVDVMDINSVKVLPLVWRIIGAVVYSWNTIFLEEGYYFITFWFSRQTSMGDGFD